MEIVFGILWFLWFLWFLVSIHLIFVFVGMSGLVGMFPEGKRWWQLPSQLLTIAHFAIVILCHPFGGG